MMGFKQGVGPAGFFACRAHGHEITELCDVAARLQDDEGGNGRTRHLNDVALAEPVVTPNGLDLRTEPATHRSEIVQTFCTPMNLKRGKDDTTTAQHTGQTVQAFHGRLRLHHDGWLLHKPFNPSAKFCFWT